jgi:hypothetical protein
LKKLLALLLIIGGILPGQTPGLQMVYLSNGDSIAGEIGISKDEGEEFVVINDTLRLAFDNVDAYRTAEGIFYIRENADLPAKERKLEVFRLAERGRINLYSQTSFRWEYNGGYWVGSGPRATYMPQSQYTGEVHQYFNKNVAAPVRPVSYENLRTALADNARSQQHLDRYDNLKYWLYGSVIVGTAMAIGGIVQLTQGEGGGKGLAIGGAVLIALRFPIGLLRDRAIDDAVASYNKGD